MDTSLSPIPKFRGYGAAPLKRLHIRPATTDNASIVDELDRVAQQEDFEVLIEDRGNFYPPPLRDSTPNKTLNTWPWVQDEQTFVYGPNGQELIIFTSNNPDGTESGNQLAAKLGLPSQKAKTFLEGGNTFILKDPEAPGKFKALVGKDTLELTAEKLAQDIAVNSIRQARKADGFLDKKQVYQQALEQMADDLKLPPERLHIIPQPDFHLDISIRPLAGNTILLNDPQRCLALLKKAARLSKEDPGTRSQIQWLGQRVKQYVEYLEKNNYASTDEIERQLKKLGYHVIRIPGIFNFSTTPITEHHRPEETQGLATLFTNAIVHQRSDGSLVFITNKSMIPIINQLFEEELLRQAPQISRIYWIGGKELTVNGTQTNQISQYLAYQGGIHCLTCEEPDFERWAFA
jgi:hypothetical protein